MRRGIRWLFLVVLLALLLWTLPPAIKLWDNYLTLNDQVRATAVVWRIQEESENLFLPYGMVHYTVDDRLFHADLPLSDHPFRNVIAAGNALSTLPMQPVVYIDRQNPHLASFTRELPWMETLKPLVILSLFGYFALLLMRRTG